MDAREPRELSALDGGWFLSGGLIAEAGQAQSFQRCCAQMTTVEDGIFGERVWNAEARSAYRSAMAAAGSRRYSKIETR